MIKAHKEILFLILLFTLLRLWVAPSFGLGVDEAHYLLYAVHLDLSYVDHPPLVGWIHAPIYYLLGTNELLVRLPAIILFAFASFQVYLFTLGFSGSKNISLLAALAVNSSMMLNVLSLMLLPDSILFVLIFLLISLVKKIEESPEVKYFIYLGIILGLAGLAKYTSALLVPAFLVYLMIKKRFDLLFSKNTIFTAVIAFFLIAPVLYWNLQNEFVSFRYQGRHVLGSSSIGLKPFLLSLAAQAGSFSPFLFGVAFYGFFKGLRSKNDSIRLSLLLGGIVLVFSLYFSFYDLSLPHWGSPFYLLFIPIGIYFLSVDGGKIKRYILNISIGISLIVTLLLYFELAAKWFTFPDYQSPFRDIYGFATIAKEADAILKENNQTKKALAVTEWTMGSRIMYYSMPYKNEVFVIDNRVDQFDFWQKNSPLEYDLLFVQSHFSGKEDFDKKFQCSEVSRTRSIDIMLRGGKVDRIELVWCKNFRGEKNGRR